MDDLRRVLRTVCFKGRAESDRGRTIQCQTNLQLIKLGILLVKLNSEWCAQFHLSYF
jgi:hypothetical protein